MNITVHDDQGASGVAPGKTNPAGVPFPAGERQPRAHWKVENELREFPVPVKGNRISGDNEWLRGGKSHDLFPGSDGQIVRPDPSPGVSGLNEAPGTVGAIVKDGHDRSAVQPVGLETVKGIIKGPVHDKVVGGENTEIRLVGGDSVKRFQDSGHALEIHARKEPREVIGR